MILSYWEDCKWATFSWDFGSGRQGQYLAVKENHVVELRDVCLMFVSKSHKAH